MTPKHALQILDAATAPNVAGRLTRIDYANIQAALETLQAVLEPKPEKEAPDNVVPFKKSE